MIFSQISIFPGSSVVERSAVNRLVVGSNPTLGANLYLRTRKRQIIKINFNSIKKDLAQ